MARCCFIPIALLREAASTIKNALALLSGSAYGCILVIEDAKSLQSLC
jgi:hypothetical protein